MTVRVLQGHVLQVLADLPARSVHTVCTSPPYWGLRSYGTPPQVWGTVADERCAQGHAWGPELVDHKRGQDAGPAAQVGNTVARVCPPTTQQGALCQRCGAWRGELGSEPTLDLFVAHLVAVMAAVGRVLRDDGTLWINLGDSYASGEVGRHDAGDPVRRAALGTTRKFEGRERQQSGAESGLAQGNLCMAPARFALAMQAAGWRLRSEITLCKTAPMPESVQGARWERCRVKTAEGKSPARNFKPELARGGGIAERETAEWADCPGCPRCEATDGLVQRWGSGRPTSATEKLFLFSKGAGAYFYDLEGVRVPNATVGDRREGQGRHVYDGKWDGTTGTQQAFVTINPAGRNLWNWLPWSPEPLAHAHYAAYPRWLPRLAIQAGTSERGVCPTCGAPWLRCISRANGATEAVDRPKHLHSASSTLSLSGHAGAGWEERGSTTATLGWRQSCRCAPHQPSPATCLDPFSGSGTTLLEANALGRHGIGVELQERYVAITHQRLAGAPLSLFAWEGQAPLGADAAGAGEEVAG